jgi:hypothetical protein
MSSEDMKALLAAKEEMEGEDGQSTGQKNKKRIKNEK